MDNSTTSRWLGQYPNWESRGLPTRWSTRLCFSAEARVIRFPSGDSVGIPGYDGHLIAEGVPPYVPDGESVWEFGTGQDYLSKANDDYAKRTINPGCVDPSRSTFVYVIPR